MGDIGPAQQRYEVLPVRQPADPVPREPAVEAEAHEPTRPAVPVPH